MLNPPFSRIASARSRSQITANKPLDGDILHIKTFDSIPHTIPAAVRCGDTLVQTKHDLDAYYNRELRTERLNQIHKYLWLAGLPGCARPLHRQQLLGRELLITEDVDEHLVWHETRIFIKPFPAFLFSVECWEQKLCKDKQLFDAACGFLLSYVWLVRHESDLRIAHERGLLPHAVDWATWTEYTDDFLDHIDLQSLLGISPRFQFGELRLSRLNTIYRFTRFQWRDFVRGYMTVPTWYQYFFARNFRWLLAVFAMLSVALSAMQVVVALERGGQAFAEVSYGFSIASLFLTAGSVLAVILMWTTLFAFHLLTTQMHDRKIKMKRQSRIKDRAKDKC